MTKTFTTDIARCTKVTMLSEDVITRSGNSPDRKQVCFVTFWRQIVSPWIKESQISLSASSWRREPRAVTVIKYTHFPTQETYTSGTVVTFKQIDQLWRILVSTSPFLSPNMNNTDMTVCRISEMLAAMLIILQASAAYVDEIRAFLGYNAAYSGNFLPTFRDKTSKKIRFLDHWRWGRQGVPKRREPASCSVGNGGPFSTGKAARA